MKLTIAQVAEATKGEVSGDSDPSRLVEGFSWDSRAVKPGWLYVALPGERVDGHDFVGAAVRGGAVAVLVTRPVETSAAVIQVEDATAALSRLARYWRETIQGRVIGLTGSNGKTTTKNLVRDVLAVVGSVVATEANQNNELGVPRTILSADVDTASVVVEMGMRGLGQIAELAEFAQPEWGLITNVGESHMELLGSRENIARAKAELFEALPDERGIAFVNAADDFAGEVCEIGRLEERGIRIVLFGNSGHENGSEALSPSRVWASNVAFDDGGRPTFTMNAVGFEEIGLIQADGSCTCSLQLRGAHNVSNACSAAAVGLAAGLTLQECCDALAKSLPEEGRQQFMRTPQGALVVNDAYNANSDSMKASLDTFATLDVPGRRIAVLGDMGELGSWAMISHERVGRIAAESNLDELVCVGQFAHHIADAAKAAGMDASAIVHFDTLEPALARIKGRLGSGDAVLVKASHFMQFDRIVKGLVD